MDENSEGDDRSGWWWNRVDRNSTGWMEEIDGGGDNAGGQVPGETS